jgi:hypothetical protein
MRLLPEEFSEALGMPGKNSKQFQKTKFVPLTIFPSLAGKSHENYLQSDTRNVVF